MGKTVGAELIGSLSRFHCVLLWFQLSEALIDSIFLNPKQDILFRVHLQIFFTGAVLWNIFYLFFLFFSIFFFSTPFLSPSCKDLSSKRVGVGGREGGNQSGEQEPENARLWLLLLVGCCLMDRRGRSEVFSLIWRSRSTETIFTGKDKQEEKMLLLFKRKCF